MMQNRSLYTVGLCSRPGHSLGGGYDDLVLKSWLLDHPSAHWGLSLLLGEGTVSSVFLLHSV